MNKVIASEHGALQKYKETISRIINSAYPEMDKHDIERAVDWSITKRFKNFDLQLQNNYTKKTMQGTMLDMLDYIEKRQPIITAYGTMFLKHDVVPNPMGKVIQSFLDLRKKHKKEMFKYPKNSEMFEHFNLLQALDKIDVNGIYGLVGLYMSILFDLNIAPAVTSTGRSLISSAIMCFEGFLGNNVKFGSLNDILIFIDHVRTEHVQWKYNDYDILGNQGFVSVDEAFTKIMMNCGYKYIPTEEDMDLVYKIIQNCNQIELNRLFYKNNLYCFMDLPIARNLMVQILTGMKRPYIEPADPPEEIIEPLNYLRDLLVEYVFYCYQYIDRVDRNKNMIKTVSIVSDTDSSFVSLDAWYNYNIEYLKDYDCMICHQQIDLYKAFEAEKKSDDYYWKDTETPEWYNCNDKRAAISFIKKDEFGDFDPKDIQAVEFLEDEKDYDFYKEEIIDKKRMIDPLKIIPQDNMKFALINIMCYILSTVINLYMIDFTRQSGSYRGDSFCKINMKNEFYMSRILLTAAKKNYTSLQILQEGNYLGNGVLDAKGIPCLTKSVTSDETKKALKKILLEDILTAPVVDQMKIIKDVAILEKTFYNDLQSGSKKYYKPSIIKSMDNYENPLRIQGIKAALAWNYVRYDLPAFDLSERNSIDIAKIKITPQSLEAIRLEYPEQYKRFMNIIDPKCNDPLVSDRITVSEVFKGKIDSIAIPKDVNVPNWLKPFIDYETLISDNLKTFPISSLGIETFDRRVNYSNVIKL